MKILKEWLFYWFPVLFLYDNEQMVYILVRNVDTIQIDSNEITPESQYISRSQQQKSSDRCKGKLRPNQRS